MEQFIQKYEAKVIDKISGFDRMVFRGSFVRLRWSAECLIFFIGREYYSKILGNTGKTPAKNSKSFAGSGTEENRAAQEDPRRRHRLRQRFTQIPAGPQEAILRRAGQRLRHYS